MPVGGRYNQRDVTAVRVGFTHREERHNDPVVRAVEEAGVRAVQGSDHPERLPVDIDLLAQRIQIAKQALLSIGADHGHRIMMPVFQFREKPALVDIDLAGLCVRFFHAAQLRLVNRIPLIFRDHRPAIVLP